MKNITLAYRSLFKKGRSNGIKILSLGVGLAVGLVLIAKIYFEQTYDDFYPAADRIYRIYGNYSMPGEEGGEPSLMLSGYTSGGVAPGLKTEIPAPFKKPVMFGGPVQDDRGFVLHTPDVKFNSMLTISDNVAFTTSRDILEAIASGTGPEKMLVSIGYAGWSAGQLEQEISHNGWLTVSADPSIIFDLPISQRYTAAIKLLGFDPNKLTYEVGHA